MHSSKWNLKKIFIKYLIKDIFSLTETSLTRKSFKNTSRNIKKRPIMRPERDKACQNRHIVSDANIWLVSLTLVYTYHVIFIILQCYSVPISILVPRNWDTQESIWSAFPVSYLFHCMTLFTNSMGQKKNSSPKYSPVLTYLEKIPEESIAILN